MGLGLITTGILLIRIYNYFHPFIFQQHYLSNIIINSTSSFWLSTFPPTFLFALGVIVLSCVLLILVGKPILRKNTEKQPFSKGVIHLQQNVFLLREGLIAFIVAVFTCWPSLISFYP